MLSELSECPEVQPKARVKEGSPAALFWYKPLVSALQGEQLPLAPVPLCEGGMRRRAETRTQAQNYFNESSKAGHFYLPSASQSMVCVSAWLLVEDQIELAECGLVLCKFNFTTQLPIPELLTCRASQFQCGVATGPAGPSGWRDRPQGVRAGCQPHSLGLPYLGLPWSSDPSRLAQHLPPHLVTRA